MSFDVGSMSMQHTNPKHRRNERRNLGISARRQKKMIFRKRFVARVSRRLHMMGLSEFAAK